MEQFLLWAVFAVFGDVDPTIVAAHNVCAVAVYEIPAMADVRRVPGAFDVCVKVAMTAIHEDVSPAVAVAVAYHESRFQDVPSARGQRMLAQGKVERRDALPPGVEQGPMQVKPRWHCPKGSAVGCDWTLAGVRLLKNLHLKHKTWEKALAHYKSPHRPSFSYQYRVWSRVRSIEQRVASNAKVARG